MARDMKKKKKMHSIEHSIINFRPTPRLAQEDMTLLSHKTWNLSRGKIHDDTMDCVPSGSSISWSRAVNMAAMMHGYETLDLSRNYICDDDLWKVKGLVEMLPSSFNTIDLSHTVITQPDGCDFMDILTNDNIKHIVICYTEMSDSVLRRMHNQSTRKPNPLIHDKLILLSEEETRDADMHLKLRAWHNLTHEQATNVLDSHRCYYGCR